MSSRPLFRPELAANAVSMTTTSTSLISNINTISAIGYTISYGAGSSGTFTVEVSNDYAPTQAGVVPSPADAGTWVTLPTTPAVASTGSAGTAFIDVVGTSAAWIRLRFTNTAGSGGTYSATLAGKVL